MLISFVWLYMFKCDVYAQFLVDQTQKDFWVFYKFLKVILILLCIYFLFKNAILSFSSKTSSEVFSQVARDLELPTKFKWGKLKITFSYRNSRYYFASISRLTFSREMVFRQKMIFFFKSHRNFRNCLAPNSQLTTSRESICASVALFATVSQLIRYCLTHEKRVFSIFM